MSIFLLVTILLTGPAESRLEIDRERDLYRAPRVSRRPIDLPEPQVAPMDGIWIEASGKRWPAGVFLPPALNIELRRRSRALDRLPELFQLQLDELKRHHELEIEKAIDQTEVRLKIERIQEQLETSALDCDEMMSFFEKVGWGAILLTIGAVVGGMIVFVTGR